MCVCSAVDKVRIIALYIMHRDGVPEGDKKRLYQHARLALHEMDAIDNLTHLGLNVNKVMPRRGLVLACVQMLMLSLAPLQDSGKKRKPLFKQREEEDAYDISRYQPALRFMLEVNCCDYVQSFLAHLLTPSLPRQSQFAGTLDPSTFPYVRDAPVGATKSSAAASAAPPPTGSLRSARPQWTAQRTKRVVDAPRQRVLVFMAGGATYSEVRAVYKVSEAANKDVFLGTSHLVTPQKFVSDLANLVRGGGGSSHTKQGFQPLLKGGKALPPRAPGMPQQAIDQRYPQQVQPPPAPAPTLQQKAAASASDARRPSSLVASLKGSTNSKGSSSTLAPGATLQHSTSGSSLGGQSMQSATSDGASSGKIKKKGFLKRLM